MENSKNIVPIAKRMTVSGTRNKPNRKGDRLIEFVVDSVFIILGGWFWGSPMFSEIWGAKFPEIFKNRNFSEQFG